MTNAVTGTIRVESFAVGVSVTSESSKVYVTSLDSNKAPVIDNEDKCVITTTQSVFQLPSGCSSNRHHDLRGRLGANC